MGMTRFLALSVLAGAIATPSFGLAQAVDNGHHPVWAPDGRIYVHVARWHVAEGWFYAYHGEARAVCSAIFTIS